MKKELKQHLLGILYEHFEKRYYNALHQKQSIIKYQKWLGQLNNRKIESKELIDCLLQIKESTKLYDMPLFIDNLIANRLINDRDVSGLIKNFETPSFF